MMKIAKPIERLFTIIGVIAVVGLLVQAVYKTEAQQSEVKTLLEEEAKPTKVVGDYTIKAIPIPEDINFAGERIPVEDPDVLKRLDREMLVNTYWQSNGLLLFKRANQYFPIIEPILAKNGVPDDFKYLAVAESALDNVVSPAGAAGFWQFMQAAGREYGLEINANVDERYNLEKATEAACKYLLKAKDRFGTWSLAAASYNAGSAGIARQQKRQESTDYYDLLLNSETSRYMLRIVAIKEIMENPYKYGFEFEKRDLYPLIPTYAVEVDTAIQDFPKFAKQHGINYKILKIHNPWLRETHLNNQSRKKYKIQIPEKGYYPGG